MANVPDDRPPGYTDPWLPDFPGYHEDLTFAFAEWLEVQAQVHAALGGTAGAWLAERICEIATTARYVQARTPDEFDARVQVLEWDRDHAIEERGHARAAAMQN